MTENVDSQCKKYPHENRRKSCEFAEKASDIALHKFMLTFGYDIEKSQDRARLLDMIKFLESLSKFAGRSVMALAAIFAALVAGTFFIGMKTTIMKWFSP